METQNKRALKKRVVRIAKNVFLIYLQKGMEQLS